MSMTDKRESVTIGLYIQKWGPLIAQAALGFEARWTRRALRNHNPEWAARFEQYLRLYDAALNAGTGSDIDKAAKNLFVAYNTIAAELARADVPDDAYQIGRDPDTGLKIAIGPPAIVTRVQEVHGAGVVCFSPDEIATIIALDARAKKIAAIKAAFPGAEMVDVRGKGAIFQ